MKTVLVEQGRGPVRAMLVAFSLVGWTACASAHDIVIFPEYVDGALVVDVKYGHPEDYWPIVADKLYSFGVAQPGGDLQSWRNALTFDGSDLRLTRKPGWDPSSGIALVAGQYDNGYWSKNEAGDTVNTSRVAHPRSPVASHNLKYSKGLVVTGSSHAGFDRVVGHKLELVPLRDPFAARVGDKLPVMVRFNGRPLPNSGVEIGDSVTAIPEERIARYKTDAKGIAMVPIGKGGWEVIGVDHEEPSPTKQLADKEKYTATLVFRLP